MCIAIFIIGNIERAHYGDPSVTLSSKLLQISHKNQGWAKHTLHPTALTASHIRSGGLASCLSFPVLRFSFSHTHLYLFLLKKTLSVLNLFQLRTSPTKSTTNLSNLYFQRALGSDDNFINFDELIDIRIMLICLQRPQMM